MGSFVLHAIQAVRQENVQLVMKFQNVLNVQTPLILSTKISAHLVIVHATPINVHTQTIEIPVLIAQIHVHYLLMALVEDVMMTVWINNVQYLRIRKLVCNVVILRQYSIKMNVNTVVLIVLKDYVWHQMISFSV